MKSYYKKIIHIVRLIVIIIYKKEKIINNFNLFSYAYYFAIAYYYSKSNLLLKLHAEHQTMYFIVYEIRL